MTTFTEFVRRFNDGSIVQDAAWRAYDIENMAKPRHAKAALPLVGYMQSLKCHPYSGVAAKYGIANAVRAEWLLSLWYVWRAIAMGDRRKAKRRVTGD